MEKYPDNLIFLSHAHENKEIVEQIAIKLKNVFGENAIFYDSWSIVPGNNFIQDMNRALSECKFFFVFISDHSNNSAMVEKEWSSALTKAVYNKITFVPILLEPVSLPTIFTDFNCLNVYTNGVDVTVRQIIDLVSNQKTGETPPLVENLIYTCIKHNNGYRIKIWAQHYLEPIPEYILVPECNAEDVIIKPQVLAYTSNMFPTTNNGEEKMSLYFGVERPAMPGFSLIVDVEHRKRHDFEFKLYHRISDSEYRLIKRVKNE